MTSLALMRSGTLKGFTSAARCMFRKFDFQPNIILGFSPAYRMAMEKKFRSKVYPLFKATPNGIEMDNQGRPVMPIVELLTDYAYATPDDTEWMGKLVISATKLNSALGAKKRAVIDQAVSDTADKVTKAPLKVSKPLDVLEDEDEDQDNNEWDEDGDEF